MYVHVHVHEAKSVAALGKPVNPDQPVFTSVCLLYMVQHNVLVANFNIPGSVISRWGAITTLHRIQ